MDWTVNVVYTAFMYRLGEYRWVLGLDSTCGVHRCYVHERVQLGDGTLHVKCSVQIYYVQVVRVYNWVLGLYMYN